jgi:hypothetical protein
MPEQAHDLRSTVRDNLRKRLAMSGHEQLPDDVEREVVDVCALMVNHYQYGRETKMVDGLRRRNAVLREALAVHRTKARIFAKAATTWEQRFNRLKKETSK